jgi:hypothetical protein
VGFGRGQPSRCSSSTKYVLATHHLRPYISNANYRFVERNLQDLRYALYNVHSEATCRIAVDIMLVQCRKYLRDKYQPTKTEANFPSTPTKAVANIDIAAESMQHVMLFPEASMSVEMPNKSIPDGRFLVTGRVDWALGYSTAGDEGALLIAMVAKQRSEFGKGEAQLIAYLAILRENRLRAKKVNITTQGFYSDGSRFAFICITADGNIERSSTFDIDFGRDLKMVFNFIVTIMETAMKSTPNATPTKPGQQQEKEINNFNDEVWSKVFADSIVPCSDDDMEGVIDFS